MLSTGSKIVYQDFECAVSDGPTTLCTKGSGDTLQWMKISADETGIGPATTGLPEGFPDPNDFVVGMTPTSSAPEPRTCSRCSLSEMG